MKKMRILSDPTLVISGAISLLLITITCVSMIILIKEENLTNPDDIVLVRSLWIGLGVGYWLAVIGSGSRILCILTLSNLGITVWLPFRKKEAFSYSQFRFVYIGGYFHGNIAGMGKPVWYIVISQRRLSTKELHSINNVSNSKEIIKIRYTKKIYLKIRNVLPTSHSCQLDIAIKRMLAE